MKAKSIITCATGIFSVAALTFVPTPLLMAQPVAPAPPPVPAAPPPVPSQPPTPQAPPSTVQAPPTIVPSPGAPPAIPPSGSSDVSVSVGVPENYVWDGQEYVGVIGDQYYYLGPNNVWLPMNSDRRARFHDWTREHQDWREHAIRNERYRIDSHGKAHPLHEHDADHRIHD